MGESQVSLGDVDEILDQIRGNIEAPAAPPASAVRFYVSSAQEPQMGGLSAEEDYLADNPDVAAAIERGEFESALDHWLRCGMREGRAAHFAETAQAGGPSQAIGFERLRLRHAQLQARRAELGAVPPSPFTLRGRVGGLVLAVVRRLLWWHMRQSARFAEAVEHQSGQMIAALQQVARLQAATAVQVEALAGQVQETVEAFRGQMGGLRAGLETELHTREELAVHMDHSHARLDQGLSAEMRAREALAVKAGTTERRLAELAAYVHDTRSELSLQSHLLRRLAAGGAEPASPAAPAADDHSLDALYVAFEDVFRGQRAEIKERHKIYLPLLQAAGAGSVEAPVLDLGCGRGEWLELLGENQMSARGVERNRIMAERCQSQDLDVLEGDALFHLRALPDRSLGAVTCFHMVEHLSFEHVIDLLDESLRVLRPGGLIVLETPNPANVSTASHAFYLDPTHRHPLPSAMLRFFVEARGFCNAQILELHPPPAALALPEEANLVAQRFNEYFYGPQDYAVVARRP